MCVLLVCREDFSVVAEYLLIFLNFHLVCRRFHLFETAVMMRTKRFHVRVVLTFHQKKRERERERERGKVVRHTYHNNKNMTENSNDAVSDAVRFNTHIHFFIHNDKRTYHQ